MEEADDKDVDEHHSRRVNERVSRSNPAVQFRGSYAQRPVRVAATCAARRMRDWPSGWSGRG